MGTKMAVAFANIFMAEVETKIQFLTKALLNHQSGKGILTIYSQFGIYTKPKSRNSLSQQKSTTKLSSLRLKYHIRRLRSLTQTFSKANDSLKNLYQILKRISNLLKHFSIRISQAATHQGSKKASSRAKHLDFSEQSPLKMDSRLKSSILGQALLNEDTQKALLSLHSQISNLRPGTKLS